MKKLSLALTVCMSIPANLFASDKSSAQPETWLTIFVHGIISVQQYLTIPNIIRFRNDRIENCLYEEGINIIREDKVFRRAQAMQDLGLCPIDMKGTNAASLVARCLDAVNHHINPNQTTYYYTFGWDGLLSPKKRYEAGKRLYKELTEELAKLRMRGIEPKIRLISYSHGGNVCLNLAAVSNNESDIDPLAIEEFLMFGLPVQQETDYLVGNPIFKNVFNFYSLGDRVQPLDCFASKKSQRTFKPHDDFELPSNLVQVELRVTRLAKRINPARMPLQAQLHQKAYIVGNSYYLKDASPGHSELWFFSWTPTLYRQSFPLNPLPTVAIAPLLTHGVRTFLHEHADLKNQPLVVDVRPEHDLILTRAKGSCDYLAQPFIPQDLFDDLKRLAHENRCVECTKQLFHEHMNSAYAEGKKLHKAKRMAKKRACHN